jgi:hypothetical protein
MAYHVIGKKTVASAGTRLQLIATVPTKAQGICIQALSSNTGKVYIGDSTVVGSTLVGCGYVLGIPAGAVVPSFSTTMQASNGLDVSQFYIDVDVNGEGVLVSYIRG